MSQYFKSKYEQMQENSQSTLDTFENPELQGMSPPRNLCFILEDGSQVFLNYGYLISGSVDPQKEKITLTFTSHEVQLEGFKLDELFHELLQHKTRLIKAEKDRYMVLEKMTGNCVQKIKIVQNS